MSDSNRAIALFDKDMSVCEEHRLSFGQVVFYSRQSPEKNTGNEDAAAIIPVGENAALLTVADGVGSYAGSAQAAKITVQALVESMCVKNAAEDIDSLVITALRVAKDAIETTYPGAATTIAVAFLHDDTIKTYHIGDSEIVVINNTGDIKSQTVSHSPVGYAYANGFLNEKEAMFHVSRNLISNAIGVGEASLEISSPSTLESHDTIVLATDGLFDNLFKHEIADILRDQNLPWCGQQLLSVADRRMQTIVFDAPHKPDDITFILFRFIR